MVQLEFPWALGPSDGRYVVRDGDGGVERVVVLDTLGAPERRGLLRRGKREAIGTDPPPAPVTTGRATLVVAHGGAANTDEDEVGRALAALNRLLHAHRVAARDHGVRAVVLDHALAVRVGWASGDDAAAGRLTEGEALPPAVESRGPARRASPLRPTEHLAAILAGRARPLSCESLVLRAREDIDAGRPRDAALQLSAALRAALAELPREELGENLAARLAELRELTPGVEELADAEEPGPDAIAPLSAASRRPCGPARCA